MGHDNIFDALERLHEHHGELPDDEFLVHRTENQYGMPGPTDEDYFVAAENANGEVIIIGWD